MVRELKKGLNHASPILNICLSSDEKLLITRGCDSIIKLIDIRMCRVIKTLTDPSYEDRNLLGKTIAFGQNDKSVLAGSTKGDLLEWDIQTGEVKSRFENGH